MIGVFDSGFGGLTILKELLAKMPEYDFVYLGDNARNPYGPRSAEEIFLFTLEGIEELFSRGCPLVILACNTSSANALRRIQQEVLPEKYPDRRVLGILVPTIEQLEAGSVVGILATEATVRSNAYVKEAAEKNPSAMIVQQACPNLVPLIERGASGEELQTEVRGYVEALIAQNPKIETVLLGCTHYALIADHISQELPKGVKLLGQSAIVAEALADYLARHPEIDQRLTKGGSRTFLTTGDANEVSRLGSKFFGDPIQFENVRL